MLLAEDLTIHFQEHPDHRLLIVIDEYERLWPEGPAGYRDNATDAQLQRFIANTKGTVFAFFSRYPLHWDRYHAWWRPILKGRQHALGGLPTEAAEEILEHESEPIVEPEVRRAMIANTKDADGSVYPFFLELQIKHYVELKRSGESPSAADFVLDAQDFEGTRRQLTNRLLRDYGYELESSLKRLTVARWFNADIGEQLRQKFGNVADFDRIRNLSFVEQVERTVSPLCLPFGARRSGTNWMLPSKQLSIAFCFQFTTKQRVSVPSARSSRVIATLCRKLLTIYRNLTLISLRLGDHSGLRHSMRRAAKMR